VNHILEEGQETPDYFGPCDESFDPICFQIPPIPEDCIQITPPIPEDFVFICFGLQLFIDEGVIESFNDASIVECPPPETECDDEIDNNGNGCTDCDDPYLCDDDPVCDEF
jgi:hypothetical protein